MAGLPPGFNLGDILGQNMSGELANSVAAQAGPYVGGLPALPVGGSTGIYNNPILRNILLRSRLAAFEPMLAPTIAPPGGFPMGPASTFGGSVVPYQSPLVPARIPGTAVVPTRTLGSLIPEEVVTNVSATVDRPLQLNAGPLGVGAGSAAPTPYTGPLGPGAFRVPAPNVANVAGVADAGVGSVGEAPWVKPTAGAAAEGPGALGSLVERLAPKATETAGKQWWQRLLPGMEAAPSLMRGAAGLGAGLVTEKLAGGLGDVLVGGEAEDPGFSWGGLGKAAAAGAAGGAATGLVTSGGAFSLPLTAIGALLGGGSYLLNEKSWADKEVDINAEKAKMQSFVTQYGIDPTLAKQVIGNYDLMSQVYMQDKDLRGNLKDLTRQSMTSLAGLIGQRSTRLSPDQIRSLSGFALEQLQPYYNQISENSPYKVAALQQMAAIPANISLAGLTSPEGIGMMNASNAPAQMAAGLSPEQMKALENA